MNKFYFRRKNAFYYFSIIFIVFMLPIIIFLGVLFLESAIKDKDFFSIAGVIFSAFAVFYFILMLCNLVKTYNRSYSISNGKIEFEGVADFKSVVHGSAFLNFKKEQKQAISISEIPYIFITKFVFRTGSVLQEMEKIENKKQVMGYMFLLNKFVYDEKRCQNSYVFDTLNSQGDYNSQFYQELLSMSYQEEALNHLFLNGFKGEVFISSQIYEPRKQAFDQTFSKNQISLDKIHVVA